MRIYTFTHFILSPIQQGIQASHAKDEMAAQFSNGKDEASLMYQDWLKNHKTHIALNGGNTQTLSELYAFLLDEENPYPWTRFREDDETLGGLMTSVAIVLPEKIYEASAALRKKEIYYNSDFKGYASIGTQWRWGYGGVFRMGA